MNDYTVEYEDRYLPDGKMVTFYQVWEITTYNPVTDDYRTMVFETNLQNVAEDLLAVLNLGRTARLNPQ